MRILVLSLCLLAAGCASTDSTTESTHKVALAVFEAFNAHDWKKMESLYDDKVEMQDPAYPGGKIGKSEMTAFYQSVPDIHDEIKSMTVSGQTAVVEFVSTGTIEGKSFSLPICSVLTISDGKVIKDHTYYDQEN